MKLFSQTDPKWSHLKLGKSPCTMKRFGCTTTAICMILSKVGNELTPDKAAMSFPYNSDGLIEWGKLKLKGMMFVNRFRGFGKADEVKLKEWIKEGKFAIVEVRNKYIPYHWLAVDRVALTGLTGVDPLGGIPLRIKSKYEIIGYSLFQKI